MILLQCKFFEEAALERRYLDHYGPNQRRRSITTLPTCLAEVFRRTCVSKMPSASYRVRLLSPCRKLWVHRNSPKLQLFGMVIIFDIRRYISMGKYFIYIYRKRILSLKKKSIFFMDIRLSATIVKFDGWANHIVTLTSKSKKLDYNFCQHLPSATYVGIIANRATSFQGGIIGFKFVRDCFKCAH